MSTPCRAPGAGWPAAERALGLWRDWNGRKEGAGAPRLPASGIGTQCQRSAGVPSNPARRWSGEGRLPSLWLHSPASQRLSHPVSGLIFHASEWKGDYNENLCVFAVRLVSQCKETRSRLPIFIFHSRFGEHSRARGKRVCSVAG